MDYGSVVLRRILTLRFKAIIIHKHDPAGHPVFGVQHIWDPNLTLMHHFPSRNSCEYKFILGKAASLYTHGMYMIA